LIRFLSAGWRLADSQVPLRFECKLDTVETNSGHTSAVNKALKQDGTRGNRCDENYRRRLPDKGFRMRGPRLIPIWNCITTISRWPKGKGAKWIG
jgi:hypothetical protein